MTSASSQTLSQGFSIYTFSISHSWTGYNSRKKENAGRASARRHALPGAPRLRVVLGLGLCLESWVVAGVLGCGWSPGLCRAAGKRPQAHPPRRSAANGCMLLGLCLESWVVAVKALAKAAFTKTMKAPLMVGNIFVNSFFMLIQQQICLFKKKPEFLPFF